MADTKRRQGPIVPGLKLNVTVEHAVQDILVVILEHGSRSFRGVLLDVKKRQLPHGICTSFGGAGTDNKLVRRSNSHGVDNHSPEESDVQLSAINFRHTYGQNLSPFGGQLFGPPHKSFPRLNGNKNVRKIRLRPRQTLCSKCKSTCIESEKGLVPVNPIRRSQSTEKPISTRQSLQTNVTQPKTYDPRLPVTRSELKRRKPMDPPPFQRQPTTKQMKLEKVERALGFQNLTKTSPFIKISVGEGTVVKIPPRIHEEKESGDVSSEEKGTDDDSSVCVVQALKEEAPKVSEDYTFSKKHKKAMKKAKERDKHSASVDSEVQNEETQIVSSHHKKHKKKHRHRHSSQPDGDEPTVVAETELVEENIEIKNENSEPLQTEVIRQRPRLLYTWRQNKGLSPRRESHSNIREDVFRTVKPFSPQRESQTSNIEPNYEIGVVPNINNKTINKHLSGERKEYKLRSREKSIDNSPYEVTVDSAYLSSYDEHKSVSDRSEAEQSRDTSCSDSDSSSDYGDGPPGDENFEALRPLMMKIQTINVTKCVTLDGRKINIGDIIWGKIQGFPWWPGRVLSITVSQRDNGVVLRQVAHISWFGSSTMSHIQCSDLFPFLEDFKLRYKRKKRGPYKMAIKQATIAAQNSSNDHQIDFAEYDL